MRKLAIIVFGALALWSGYWFVGASAVDKGLTGWLTERQNEGWVAEYSDLNTSGYPSYFETSITDLELADPNTGVAWTAPLFQIFALAYKPNHIVAILPKTQTIASPFERITIDSDNLRGSVVFEPGTALTLERTTFELSNLSLQSNQGWVSSLRTGRIATRQTVAQANTHDFFFEATDFQPTAQVLSMLDPASVLPKIIETLSIDATIGFDAPWDRFAIEDNRPQPTSVALKLLRANWGDLDLRVAGELDIDRVGTPTGTITVKAQNWREMLQIAMSAGLVPANISLTVERAMEVLAGMSGNPNTLDAPLTFKNGGMFFGPIPLGVAPRLVLR